jgi:hypothetical protein
MSHLTRLLAVLAVLGGTRAWAALAWQVVGDAELRGGPGQPELWLRGGGGVLCAASSLGTQTCVELRLVACHVAGSAPLRVGTNPQDAWPALSVPSDGKDHQVKLRLLRRADDGLFLGAAGGDGWRLRSWALGTWRPPKLEVLWAPTQVRPPLPADWQPAGPLDALPITVGQELHWRLTVGSVQVILPAKTPSLRGLREEFQADAFNQASDTAQVTVALEGPPWVWLPESSVPVKGQQHLRLRPQVASFWAGQTWAKLVLRSGAQQAAAPLQVHCAPAYPAFGFYLGPQASLSDLQAALQQPASLVMAPAGLVRELGPPRLGPEILAYGTAAQLADLAATPAAGWVRLACLWQDSAGQWAAGLRQLAASAAVRQAGWRLAVGPLHTTVAEAGLAGDSEQIAALAAGRELLSALIALAPRLPSLLAVQAEVDGQKEQVATFWRALDEAFDPAPLRTQLRSAALPLPVGWVLREPAVPDPALWTRCAASLLYQGATGLLVAWQSSAAAQPPWLEAMRELSAAVPVLAPSSASEAAVSAGARVVYKPFLRGREGCLVVSNTAGGPVEVAVELRADPFEGHLVRLAPASEPVRTHAMPFRFPKEAFAVGRPLVLLRLAPAETAVLSVRLVDPQPTWLRAVDKYERKVVTGPPEDFLPRYDERLERERSGGGL